MGEGARDTHRKDRWLIAGAGGGIPGRGVAEGGRLGMEIPKGGKLAAARRRRQGLRQVEYYSGRGGRRGAGDARQGYIAVSRSDGERMYIDTCEATVAVSR